MNSLNTLSSNTLVHLVFEQNGKRSWFNRTDRRHNPSTGVWTTIPVIGSEAHESNPMSLEMAVICQKRWRELGIECRIAKEANGPYVDDPSPKADDAPWPHQDALVTVDAEGNIVDSSDATHVYLVRAVHTTEGPKFCLRFENAILQQQSQFSSLHEGPEMAVRRAIEKGYTKLEKPRPNPYLEQRRQEAERRAAQQATRLPNNIRPGDRH